MHTNFEPSFSSSFLAYPSIPTKSFFDAFKILMESILISHVKCKKKRIVGHKPMGFKPNFQFAGNAITLLLYFCNIPFKNLPNPL
jgi:hypothetical protein